ncbi:hypothetical protein OEZ85_009407 [Tetradesmus obliquus]|uniref:Uncharacterized protein n=1 Tax=Tetradesmus obliquus TaxID=3088 RepID=A0ABY8UC11_TETOB|nr:hypothetical protein OEZ85_009407 [Tetradesmus obliquus]
MQGAAAAAGLAAVLPACCFGRCTTSSPAPKIPAGFGSMEGLAVGFNRIVRQLPAGSAMTLLAVKLVADRAGQLALHSNGSSTPQLLVDAADKLFELVQLAVQVVDYGLLPSVLQIVAAAVLAAPAAAQRGWLSALYGSCLAVDDYTRKPGLLAWLDGLAGQVALSASQQQQQQQQQQGLAAAAEQLLASAL